MTGTHQKEWGGIPPLGKKMDIPLACVFDFDDDKLINETVYFDFATLQAPAGSKLSADVVEGTALLLLLARPCGQHLKRSEVEESAFSPD